MLVPTSWIGIKTPGLFWCDNGLSGTDPPCSGSRPATRASGECQVRATSLLQRYCRVYALFWEDTSTADMGNCGLPVASRGWNRGEEMEKPLIQELEGSSRWHSSHRFMKFVVPCPERSHWTMGQMPRQQPLRHRRSEVSVDDENRRVDQ